METSNATSIKPPSHGTVRLLTGVAVVSIAICGGVLLGIASAHRAYFDAIVFVVAGFLGAVVGLVTAPAFYLAVRRKNWWTAIAAIYVPSLLSALITSDQYAPLLGALWTIAAFLVACVFCNLFVPDATPIALNNCPKCGHLQKSWALQCSKCGEPLALSVAPVRRDPYQLIMRLLPFLLIPIASIGIRFAFGPADLRSMSMEELTSSLAAHDMQRSHEATRELASRGMNAIQQLVDHHDPRVRRAVARALRWVHDDSAARLISNYLADQDRYVRLEAIAAIQYDFGPAFLPALENRIQHEKDSRVKDALAKAIAYLTNVAANDLEPYGDLTTPSTGARDRDELNW